MSLNSRHLARKASLVVAGAEACSSSSIRVPCKMIGLMLACNRSNINGPLQETSVLCLQVLKPVAAATSKVSALKGLSLKESVSQFSSTMTAQADLRVECAHLRRFYNNFASVSQSVTPPYPFPGCETAEVLIETFEPGEFALYCVDRRQKLPIVCTMKAKSALCKSVPYCMHTGQNLPIVCSTRQILPFACLSNV